MLDLINSYLAGRIKNAFSKLFQEEILYIMTVQFPKYYDMKTDEEDNEF